MKDWQLIRLLIYRRAFPGATIKSSCDALIVAIVVSLQWVPLSLAEESADCFRIPRPDAHGTQNLSDRQTNDRLLGDLIYAGMRTPTFRSSFERWRQNYCCPYICNMVLCHGTCADFAEHCPSFSESGRVIRLDSPGCFSPGNETEHLIPPQPLDHAQGSISRIPQCCK